VKRMKATIVAAVAFATALLLMAACSKNPGKAAMQKTAINLACVMNPDFSLVHLALAQGYFAAEGLAVNVKPFVIGKLALAALLAGEADLATVLETPVVFAILGGEKIGIAAVVGSSDRDFALVANRSAGIAKPGDLLGKVIGVTKGSASEYFLDSFLVAHGIPESGVKPVDTQTGDLFDALEAGRIAAAVLWNPLIVQVGEILGDTGLVFSAENIYTANDFIVGDRAFMDKNPEAMKGFVRALIRAETFMKMNPEKALTLIAEYTKSEESSLKAMLDLFRFKVSLDQSLLMVLEDESRWAMRIRPAEYKAMPAYLDFIYAEALTSVAPDRVRLVR
jgi:ABC-type nitrate/sulfonate/bicarbonate transport system substrate-binding protein